LPGRPSLDAAKSVLNLYRGCADISESREFRPLLFGGPDMPKAVRVSPPVTASKKPDHPLVTIALFCGIGLLVSLVAMMAGVQGAWR
jgi:hypothetical protein